MTKCTGVFTGVFLVLATVALVPSGPSWGSEPDSFSWDFSGKIAPDDLRLLDEYQEVATRYDQLSDELLRRYQPLPLHIELRQDLSRLRWRIRDAHHGTWSEALVCPEDRAAFDDLGLLFSARSAKAGWLPLQAQGERLLAPVAWKGRALLVRPDGKLVRLILID